LFFVIGQSARRSASASGGQALISVECRSCHTPRFYGLFSELSQYPTLVLASLFPINRQPGLEHSGGSKIVRACLSGIALADSAVHKLISRVCLGIKRHDLSPRLVIEASRVKNLLARKLKQFTMKLANAARLCKKK
jgi:hypothetical protein